MCNIATFYQSNPIETSVELYIVDNQFIKRCNLYTEGYKLYCHHQARSDQCTSDCFKIMIIFSDSVDLGIGLNLGSSKPLLEHVDQRNIFLPNFVSSVVVNSGIDGAVREYQKSRPTDKVVQLLFGFHER